MDRLHGQSARSRSFLEKRNANHVHNSHEETEAECDDQNRLLLDRKAHSRQNRYWEEENGQVSDDVHRGRRQVKREDVNAFRAGRIGNAICHGDGIALEDIDECQSEACDIDYGESDVVCPSEDLLVTCQSQVENEDRGFDGHQRRVLESQHRLHGWFT